MVGVLQGLDQNIVCARAKAVYAPPSAACQIEKLETTRAQIVESGHGPVSLLHGTSRFISGRSVRSP